MNYKKRFSVGLPVIDSVEVFDRFLDDYGQYIENIYFSLPMGDRYHSRIVTQRVLADAEKIPFFIALLRCVKKHGICLEVLFNTEGLTEEDIRAGKRFMDEHDIHPDEIGTLTRYYDIVRELFPGKRYVYSFNNFPATKRDFFSSGHGFDQYVVGRQFVRDADLFRAIKEHSSKVVLLLNNGCSFSCGGCSTLNHCHDAYYRERLQYSAEYLFALQSIFPFEINEGYIDTNHVDLFKIASRNGDVQYIRDCIDSYVHNDASMVKDHWEQYLLWSRLNWHWDSFPDFDYTRLVAMKKDICTRKDHRTLYRLPRKDLPVEFDLTDVFTLSGVELSEAVLEEMKERVLGETGIVDADAVYVQRVYLGASSCGNLLHCIDAAALSRAFTFLRRVHIKSAFVIPRIDSSGAEALQTLLRELSDADVLPDEFVVNDEKTFSVLKQMFPLPIALGRTFSLLSHRASAGRIHFTGDDRERAMLFEEELRRFIAKQEIPYILCDMPQDGLWISSREPVEVKAFLTERLVDKDLFCGQDACAQCHAECLRFSGEGCKRRGKNVYARVEITENIRSAIYERRFSCILSPWQNAFFSNDEQGGA